MDDRRLRWRGRWLPAGATISYHAPVTATPRPPASRARSRGASADSATEALKHFRLIFKSVKKHFQWVEQQTGVNGAQLWALSAIVKKPGMVVSELSQALAVHQSTASNLVDRLVRLGFIRRERNADDQRVVHLFPEAAAKELIAAAPKPVQGVLPDALGRMPIDDLVQLNLLLTTLIGKMKVRDASGKTTPLAEI